MRSHEFTPKLFTILKAGVTRQQLSRDILAGLTVGIVALPLAIAFAIASGVSPDKGLITAIVAGLIISALGGSRVQIGGPTGAFIVIVYAIVQKHGVGGLTIATFMAGFLIIGMGLARLGNLLKFIPYPLIVGFTSGIAVIILSSQVGDFFGLAIGNVPANFVEKWQVYAGSIARVNYYAAAISIATVIIAFNFHRITPKIPGSIVAIVLSTAVVALFQLPVETIATRFGKIPNHFVMPAMPTLDFATIRELIQPAFAIALLGAIESLLSAVVADGMIGGRHRSNGELVAQGAANIFSALLGGIPATGAVARTATNVKNGGRTPLAGIVHALVLLVIMLLLAPYAGLIPLACLAGILVVVAYHMSEWRHFVDLLKSNRLDVIVLLTTFLLTVFFDLIIAIEVGTILSSFMILKRMSETVTVQSAGEFSQQEENGEKLFEEELPKIPQGVALYEINGALFFGAAQKFEETLSDLHYKPKVLILRMRHVPFIDATGTHRLKEIIRHFNTLHIAVILSGVNPTVLAELEKARIYSVLDARNILGHINASIRRATELIGENRTPAAAL